MLSLYIHFPWCIKKCPYCDFNSYPVPQNLPEREYIDCLISDLKNDLSRRDVACNVSTIYIGGGTPSIISPQGIAILLNKITDLISIVPNAEISIETNPGTCSYTQLKDLFAIGINRLSIGVQSFQNDKLQCLGRIHDAKEAIQTIKSAQKAGFTNVNIDLMYGLPLQTLADAMYDLETAIDLNPTHISWYQLTLEPRTIFYKRPPELPNEDLIEQIETHGQQYLSNNKFNRYEISAYSLDDFQCQHNLNYWQFGNYLGIGAGAHGKTTDHESNIVTRTSKHSKPQDYLKAKTNFIAEKHILTTEDLITEFMLNALRLCTPIPTSLFTTSTGLPLSSITKQLQHAEQLGFITCNQNFITTTTLGKKFLNQLLELF